MRVHQVTAVEPDGLCSRSPTSEVTVTGYLWSISHACGGAEMTPRVLTCSAALSGNPLTCPRG